MNATQIAKLARDSYTVPGGGIALVTADIGDGEHTYRIAVGAQTAAISGGERAIDVETPAGPASVEVALVTHCAPDGRPLSWSSLTRGAAQRVVEVAS